MQTDADILATVVQFAEKIGHTPGTDEWKAAGMKPSYSVFKRRFGSWGEAMLAAGLPYAHHRLKSQNGRQGVCIICGPVKLLWKSKNRERKLICQNSGDGVRSMERLKERKLVESPYLVHRKDHCENPDCQAVILHLGMLDVHHVDHNHDNNDPNNLVTLCANCHRGVHYGVVTLPERALVAA